MLSWTAWKPLSRLSRTQPSATVSVDLCSYTSVCVQCPGQGAGLNIKVLRLFVRPITVLRVNNQYSIKITSPCPDKLLIVGSLSDVGLL